MNIHSARPASSVKFMAFLALTAAFVYGQNSSATKPLPLPSVQQVMDHYVGALGGHDASFRHKSMTVRGTFVVSDKVPSLDRDAYYKDGKMLYEIILPNGSRYQEAFDGTVAWQLQPGQPPAISEGNEVKSKQRDADMHYPGHLLDYFSSMNVVDVTDFEGHTCYQLKGMNKWGIVNEHFYDIRAACWWDTSSIRAGAAALGTSSKCSPTTKILADG